jgi:glutamyl-tRNA synthetase
LGHARTFWTAYERAVARGGKLVFRNEDLDTQRCKPEFVDAMFEDLRWFGLQWEEGPDIGGPFAPYTQSERRNFYLSAFAKLKAGGYVYPCTCSRKDVQRSVTAPHAADDEPIYPGNCRDNQSAVRGPQSAIQTNWRFRVPDGETIRFKDANLDHQKFVAGRDFGDFIIWRHDQIPSYQLAVVVDDATMQITEVVRGEDLLISTARQLLIYRALGLKAPSFYHCALMKDDHGIRLAKRHDALSLHSLREQGLTPEGIRKSWDFLTD